MSGKACDEYLAADRVRRFAVKASTLFRAGRIETKALHIGRRSNVPRALHCRIQVVANLIHSDDEDNVLGALCDSRNPVSVAVDIYDYSVISHSVG